jgi:hypothetical protein
VTILLNQVQTTLNQLLPKAFVNGAWVNTTQAERVARIDEVRERLRAARSAGLAIGGLQQNSVYLLQQADGHCLHASNTELLGTNYETCHRPPEDSASDRWFFQAAPGGGERIVNEAYASAHGDLNCSSFVATPQGHTAVTTTNAGVPAFNEFYVVLERTGTYELSGYFGLGGAQSYLFLKYGTDDLTPSGRPRVYAVPQAQGSRLYYF